MFFGNSRAHGRDDIIVAVLVRHNHIHIAFDDDRHVFGADGRGSHIDTVNRAALIKNRGLRGIDILRLRAVHFAAGKSDRASPCIADGEHQPVVEAVADSTVLVFHN